MGLSSLVQNDLSTNFKTIFKMNILNLVSFIKISLHIFDWNCKKSIRKVEPKYKIHINWVNSLFTSGKDGSVPNEWFSELNTLLFKVLTISKFVLIDFLRKLWSVLLKKNNKNKSFMKFTNYILYSIKIDAKLSVTFLLIFLPFKRLAQKNFSMLKCKLRY